MFGLNHFALIACSLLLIVLCTLYIKKKKVPFEKVLTAACAICVLSELTKMLTMLETVPSADGSKMYLYLDVKNLPLHLCSIQIVVIFIIRLTKDDKLREILLAFMYPVGILSGLLALALPTFISGMTAFEVFTSPRVYQYFIYHSMLIALGINIALSGSVRFRVKHIFSSFGILGMLGFFSLYFNSMFADPVYQNGELISVEYMPNYFFTQAIPINIPLSDKGHWFLWWGFSLSLSLVLFALCFLPLIHRDKKSYKQS